MILIFMILHSQKVHIYDFSKNRLCTQTKSKWILRLRVSDRIEGISNTKSLKGIHLILNWNDFKASHVSWFLEDSVQYCKWVKWIEYSCVFEDLCDYLTVLLWNEAVRSIDHRFWKFLINIKIFVFWLACWTLTPGSHSASTPPNQLGT